MPLGTGKARTLEPDNITMDLAVPLTIHDGAEFLIPALDAASNRRWRGCSGHPWKPSDVRIPAVLLA